MDDNIDGVAIDDIITIDNNAWRRVGESEMALNRYTVYIAFPIGGANELDDDALHRGNCEVEEIDVDARDETDARIIADLVRIRDYVDGGRIVHVEERFGLYW